MAYIKLGPRAKAFNSKRYNLHLNPYNASLVYDPWLRDDLYQFLKTGYFTEISQNEFQNIKLNQNNDPNINYVPKGINTIPVVEPVIDMINSTSVEFEGARYIVTNSGNAEFDNLIIELNAGVITKTIPTDGLIVPVLSLGLSATYIGSYPSGNWRVDQLR